MPAAKRSFAHLEFLEIGDDPVLKKPRVQCKHCGDVKAANTTRQEIHLETCKAYIDAMAVEGRQPELRKVAREAPVVEAEQQETPHRPIATPRGPRIDKSLVRGQYTFLEDDPSLKKRRLQCNHCGKISAENTTRQEEHLENCQPYLNYMKEQGEENLITRRSQMTPAEREATRNRRSEVHAPNNTNNSNVNNHEFNGYGDTPLGRSMSINGMLQPSGEDVSSGAAKLAGQSQQFVFEGGISDSVRTQYMTQRSAVLTHQDLSKEVQVTDLLPLHSAAWNCGVRPEEKASNCLALKRLVSHEDIIRFSDVYFNVVHPVFGILDRATFHKKCEDYWASPGLDFVSGAVIGSVLALGSLFSVHVGHPRELDIVHHVKTVLENPAFSRAPSIDQVIAWTLRTIYLRGTTKPHLAWSTSCMTLHLAEAAGLHCELTAKRMPILGFEPMANIREARERARRTFWCAWSLNALISYEYGRSAVSLNGITVNPVQNTAGDFTAQLVSLARLIPGDKMVFTNAEVSARKADLDIAMGVLALVPDEHPFISLTKADLAFSFYRRMRMLKQETESEVVALITGIGKKAVEAALLLAQGRQPWWNVLCTPFQHICVLLSLNTTESLAMVPKTLGRFQEIAEDLASPLALDALNGAKMLVKEAVRKKREQIALLETDEIADYSDVAPRSDMGWAEYFDSANTDIFGGFDGPPF